VKTVSLLLVAAAALLSAAACTEQPAPGMPGAKSSMGASLAPADLDDRPVSQQAQTP
jgi:hypothetical protein